MENIITSATKWLSKNRFRTSKETLDNINFLLAEGRLRDLKGVTLNKISQVDLSRAKDDQSESIGEKRRQHIRQIFLAFLNQYFGQKWNGKEFVEDAEAEIEPLPDLEFDQIGFDRIRKSGIRSIEQEFKFRKVRNQFRQAKTIKIIQTILPNVEGWTNLISDALQSNCESVSILLLKPWSDAARLRGMQLGYPSIIDFNSKIHSSIVSIIRLIETKDHHSKINIRLYEEPAISSLYQYEDINGKVQSYFGIYWADTSTIEAPFFRIGNKDAVLSKAINNQFNHLWNNSIKVPQTFKSFKTLMNGLKAKYKRRNFSNPESETEVIRYFKCFYSRDNKLENFRLKIDFANEKVFIDKTTSGLTYKGIIRSVALNSNIIAHIEEGATKDRIIYILAYDGGAGKQMKDNDLTIALYSNVSGKDGAPYSNLMVIKKLSNQESYTSLSIQKELILPLLEENSLTIDRELIDQIGKLLLRKTIDNASKGVSTHFLDQEGIESKAGYIIRTEFGKRPGEKFYKPFLQTIRSAKAQIFIAGEIGHYVPIGFKSISEMHLQAYRECLVKGVEIHRIQLSKKIDTKWLRSLLRLKKDFSNKFFLYVVEEEFLTFSNISLIDPDLNENATIILPSGDRDDGRKTYSAPFAAIYEKHNATLSRAMKNKWNMLRKNYCIEVIDDKSAHEAFHPNTN